jgi:hypothetical protein
MFASHLRHPSRKAVHAAAVVQRNEAAPQSLLPLAEELGMSERELAKVELGHLQKLLRQRQQDVAAGDRHPLERTMATNAEGLVSGSKPLHRLCKRSLNGSPCLCRE